MFLNDTTKHRLNVNNAAIELKYRMDVIANNYQHRDTLTSLQEISKLIEYLYAVKRSIMYLKNVDQLK